MPPSQFICTKPDCTFSVTGTCLDSIEDPTRKCPNLKPTDLSSRLDAGDQDSVEPEPAEKPARQFPPGLEIGLHDASGLMRSRYTRLVGVVGQSNAGKTCLFTSLYLQLTNRRLLPKYRFAGSQTLQGFEQRVRHLRDWASGDIPDQIVDRTSLGNSRSPAFLHIAIHEEGGSRHEILLPDLPGEWTTQLLSDATKAQRFEFLRRSDVLLVVLEAPQLAEPLTRHNALTDARQLITRLSDDVHVSVDIPMVLGVTKCDETGGHAPTEIAKIEAHAATYGYKATTLPLAAFPKKGSAVQPGLGIDRLLEQITASDPLTHKSPHQAHSLTGRSYLTARGNL